MTKFITIINFPTAVLGSVCVHIRNGDTVFVGRWRSCLWLAYSDQEPERERLARSLHVCNVDGKLSALLFPYRDRSKLAYHFYIIIDGMETSPPVDSTSCCIKDCFTCFKDTDQVLQATTKSAKNSLSKPTFLSMCPEPPLRFLQDPVYDK